MIAKTRPTAFGHSVRVDAMPINDKTLLERIQVVLLAAGRILALRDRTS